MTATQLAIDLKPTAPLQSRPVIQPEVCPARGRCMVPCQAGTAKEPQIVLRPLAETGLSCGFEQAGTVDWCRKQRGLGAPAGD